MFGPRLDEGFARSGDPDKAARFDVAPSVAAVVTDDLDAGWATVKPQLALYIGGMGAKGKNFYHDLACRYGYQQAADTIQDSYLAGDKAAAIAAVPDELVDELSLIGPRGRIAERLEMWESAGVGTLLVSSFDPTTLRTLAELVL